MFASRNALLNESDVVLTIHKLEKQEISELKRNHSLLISFLDPFNDDGYLSQLNACGISSLSMEMLPRISRCQKMDALSSQASLAGYAMVIKAAAQVGSTLPMMMTPAGTLKPLKVFVIGAGVAGLQAIATAKRLGATVTAFDTRTVVAEQVRSLGAKFLEIDLGETNETSQGYATVLTPEQMEKQQLEQSKCIAESDIVITTAQLFGRKPPLLIKKEVISQMKPGSVIVDMAAEQGGNVEGSQFGETVFLNGIKIIGDGNWANDVAKEASQMYGNNLQHLVSEFWHKDSQSLELDLQDEILKRSLVTHKGNIVNEQLLPKAEQEVA